MVEVLAGDDDSDIRFCRHVDFNGNFSDALADNPKNLVQCHHDAERKAADGDAVILGNIITDRGIKDKVDKIWLGVAVDFHGFTIPFSIKVIRRRARAIASVSPTA